MHDPLDFETIDKLRFVLNREIEVVAGPQGSDRRGDQQILRQRDLGDRVGRLDAPGIHRHRDRLRRGWSDRRGKSATTNTLEEGDAPVIKLVHLIIQEAVTHPGVATSTSSRSPTASGSATGSTAC